MTMMLKQQKFLHFCESIQIISVLVCHFFLVLVLVLHNIGPTLSGKPEARFEAYARAYAGCGPFTTRTYRRSYSRIYEALCCKNHLMNDKYYKLFQERPLDIIGRHVRLEALDVNRHADDLYLVLSGASAFENNPYDPDEVWGFQEDGPFESAAEMTKSFVFQRKMNEGGFAIIHGVTDRVVGVIHLTNDDPLNLSIQLDAPIMTPNSSGTQLQLESCFLLMDRLFGYGYRRIQISIDAQDIDKKKLCLRLGFSLEGLMYKHMVIKDSSRDSAVYSMLNSDWKRGARTALFKKLYGDAAYKADVANEKYEEELEQQRIKKAENEAAASKKIA
jgi:RimJ/RimL family protein N-acetyltransferase